MQIALNRWSPNGNDCFFFFFFLKYDSIVMYRRKNIYIFFFGGGGRLNDNRPENKYRFCTFSDEIAYMIVLEETILFLNRLVVARIVYIPHACCFTPTMLQNQRQYYLFWLQTVQLLYGIIYLMRTCFQTNSAHGRRKQRFSVIYR